MNLREWARATYRILSDQSADERQHDISMATVERILRSSILALIEALVLGDEFRSDELGRIWVENKPPFEVISNLAGRSQKYRLDSRKRVRFRASTKLVNVINREELHKG